MSDDAQLTESLTAYGDMRAARALAGAAGLPVGRVYRAAWRACCVRGAEIDGRMITSGAELKEIAAALPDGGGRLESIHVKGTKKDRETRELLQRRIGATLSCPEASAPQSTADRVAFEVAKRLGPEALRALAERFLPPDGRRKKAAG